MAWEVFGVEPSRGAGARQNEFSPTNQCVASVAVTVSSSNWRQAGGEGAQKLRVSAPVPSFCFVTFQASGSALRNAF